MNKKKILYPLVCLSLLLGLASCDNDIYREYYTETGDAFSFFQPVLRADLLPEQGGVMHVILTRTDASTYATIGIELSSPSTLTTSLFALQSPSVSFAIGESTASADVLFDIEQMPYGNTYDFVLAINTPGAPIAIGGTDSVAVTAGRLVTWESMGDAIWTESRAFAAAVPDTIDFQRSLEDAELFRLIDPLTAGYPIHVRLNRASGMAAVIYQNTGYAISVEGKNRQLYMNATGTYDDATGTLRFPESTQNGYYTLNDDGVTFTKNNAPFYEVYKLPLGD